LSEGNKKNAQPERWAHRLATRAKRRKLWEKKPRWPKSLAGAELDRELDRYFKKGDADETEKD
jgi:hypothetical protein